MTNLDLKSVLNCQTIATSVKCFVLNTKVYIFIQNLVFNVILAIKFRTIENNDLKTIKMCIYLENYCQHE